MSFYGFLKTSGRIYSWELLAKIHFDNTTPWCVIGDFNEITNQDKKLGERLRSQKYMEAFHKTLETNGLLDIGWKN